ncbi:hypothetical protein QBC33DRAFT_216652 [Phialemonium atrogriseum]|uniref:Uncharacterized protein n=1 Tax=Phialemonium atrogriseum TaxID=1093897 RepID=A0AAJ0C5Y9_9PEZI|nr:uncharacterized protein QBC33DRAFT_216652 [Phialemonium atrogriseum]KAK1770780.1 hypothetical protein QBC33DRAFT_216652 [Phialemonium atrogriseum]
MPSCFGQPPQHHTVPCSREYGRGHHRPCISRATLPRGRSPVTCGVLGFWNCNLGLRNTSSSATNKFAPQDGQVMLSILQTMLAPCLPMTTQSRLSCLRRSAGARARILASSSTPSSAVSTYKRSGPWSVDPPSVSEPDPAGRANVASEVPLSFAVVVHIGARPPQKPNKDQAPPPQAEICVGFLTGSLSPSSPVSAGSRVRLRVVGITQPRSRCLA